MSTKNVESSHKKLSNPTYVGPGKWDDMCIMALNAQTTSTRSVFYTFVRVLCENHRCNECRTDCLAYIKQIPPETNTPILNIKSNGKTIDIGCFVWVFQFHNHVNNKLGKSPMILQDALTLYLNKEKCEKMCGVEDIGEVKEDKGEKNRISSNTKVINVTSIPTVGRKDGHIKPRS